MMQIMNNHEAPRIVDVAISSARRLCKIDAAARAGVSAAPHDYAIPPMLRPILVMMHFHRADSTVVI